LVYNVRVEKQPQNIYALEKDYAKERAEKPVRKFRLQCRALAAALAFQEYATELDPPRILDVGAADGQTLAALARQLSPQQALGLEYSQGLIDAAPPLPPPCRLLQGDASDPHPDLAENHFDLVSGLAIVAYLPTPQAFIQQALRYLKPGGLLVLTTPSAFWDHLSVKLGVLPRDHARVYTRTALHRLLSEQGFEVLSYQRFMFMPLGIWPYLHVPVAPAFALALDRVLHGIRLLDWLMTNQLVVGRKP